MTRRYLLALPAALISNQGFTEASTLTVPSPRQLAWHKLQTYAFLHFSMNTFTGKEWGYGDEDPKLFHPTAFDADSIVRALAAGGMKAVILTCKHHDGFCLWPSNTTKHSVAASGWRDGKGDVVREISQAAASAGLKFGVYLSPWDRNHAAYGTPAYVDVYREQLRELLTAYGPVFEVWHDGANGGDGYYGGAREKRTIDKHSYYDWPNTWKLVRELQPGAVIFSDVGPDIRWVGNEKGFANETCWATYDPIGENGGPPSPGDTKYKEGMTGHRKASQWMPAECDVSIRPGWFFHQDQNGRVKSSNELYELYLKSVGRGTSFLLNVPPDKRGLLHENDVQSLAGFGKILKATYANNLASPFHQKKDDWFITAKGEFDTIRIHEDIRYGQRIDAFKIEAFRNQKWEVIAQGTSVGSCRIVKLPTPHPASRLRLRITDSSAVPVVRDFGVFRETPGL